MRRQEKQIESIKEMESIILKENVLRLGLSENNMPYIVPLNYGYKDKVFYAHCAKEGKKLDMIRNNPNVCIEIDCDHELVVGNVACQYTMKFKSLIGFGKAFILESPQDVKNGLDILMAQFTDQQFDFNEKAMDRVAVIKIELDQLTGKQA